MLGAGAATIVSVLIAALIVTIDIAQTSIAGVVVITAAAREAQKAQPEAQRSHDLGTFLLLLRSSIFSVYPAADQATDFRGLFGPYAKTVIR